jgi:hypothetical protein
MAAKPKYGFEKCCDPRVASQQRGNSRRLMINHVPPQWEGKEDEAQENRSFELYYNYALTLSILFGGLKGEMGALGLRSEAPSFTKNKCSFVILFQSTYSDMSFDLITSL